jgi:septum formation protein
LNADIEPPPPIFLASKSPRRASLLRRMGFVFEILPADVREDVDAHRDPVETVKILSCKKAEAVLPSVRRGLIVGADTVVVLDGEILGKPETPGQAEAMLAKLSGKTHEVFTGFTLIDAENGRRFSDFERTTVTFRKLAEWEILDYVATGAPMDKAGAYGIQDRSGLFVERIDGCFYNVVGFPVVKFFEGLEKMWGTERLRCAMRTEDKPDGLSSNG